ncbi:MAG TPA: neutral/alkaline non-lysosomal ceramidase N-terminal domain-containing protein, partial [Polyangiales bacterium]|nr:neutral/alkaline non-lysosomal ceramidase N-terminal domain-containing protein [Polyangiales bacterium]
MRLRAHLAWCLVLFSCAGREARAPDGKEAEGGSEQADSVVSAREDAGEAPGADAAEPSGADAGDPARSDDAALRGTTAPNPPPQGQATSYRVGAAKTDITGPFVGSSTGYNSPGDEMSGLGMRLYARAFAIEEPNAQRVIALVTADMVHMYQSVKLGVVKKLKSDGYAAFSADNVLLSATHTHAAPSNISWYTLFNLFNGVVGFDPLHYQLVVDGIARAIEQAYDARKPATIKLAQGRLEAAAFNRSLPAYQANQDATMFERDVDDTMT